MSFPIHHRGKDYKTLKSTPVLETKLKEFLAAGHIVPRTENNRYLKCSYKGSGKLLSEKWNVKIYTSGAVVCNDEKVLQDLIEGKLAPPDEGLKLLQIDDAGGGFPLCGVLVGVTDGKDVWTRAVAVSFFQGDQFEKQLYLDEFAFKGLEIIQLIGATPGTHRIEICTGFINTRLKDILRQKGFDVRVVEIKGLLQDQLEELFRQYVKNTIGKDLAYDPKGLQDRDISRKYYDAFNWGKKHAPNLLKSGWKSMEGKI